MGSDAQWLAENVILPRLDTLEEKLEKRDEKQWTAIEKNKDKAHELDKEIEKLKLEKTMGENAFIRHVQNKEKHYNANYNETLRQKLWRKKPEIGAGGLVGVLITGLVGLLLKAAGVIP